MKQLIEWKNSNDKIYMKDTGLLMAMREEGSQENIASNDKVDSYPLYMAIFL